MAKQTKAAKTGERPAATRAEPAAGRPRVSVVGLGRVERAADVAHATFVAEGTRDTAAEARAVAAGAAAAVIEALAQAGVSRGDTRTAGIDVSPNWDHEDGRPVRRGFTVTNRITTAIRDLEQVGTVLDAALEAGATGLDGVTFQLADPNADSAEARRLAVADARARAETIASAAGCSLGRLVGIAEAGAPVPLPRGPMRMAAMAEMAGAPPTPVLPGSVEVTVSVTAEWELLEG
ncbi:MAG TPA: SIMPL domain-containing protein [Candidatus Limnocylindrales bacterium]|nr:SIMPL domain-containing protein [Candidatus Limnocylindrales bacterium]